MTLLRYIVIWNNIGKSARNREGLAQLGEVSIHLGGE